MLGQLKIAMISEVVGSTEIAFNIAHLYKGTTEYKKSSLLEFFSNLLFPTDKVLKADGNNLKGFFTLPAFFICSLSVHNFVQALVIMHYLCVLKFLF
jgi:hypothetical protein